PYFTKLLMERFGPRRIGRELLRGVRALSTGAADLPGQIHDILDDLRAGKLEIAARDPELALATDRLGRRVFTAVVATALLAAATALEIADRHPNVAAAFLAIAALAVVAHMWGDRRRGRKR